MIDNIYIYFIVNFHESITFLIAITEETKINEIYNPPIILAKVLLNRYLLQIP